jgi:hypothetical protein
VRALEVLRGRLPGVRHLGVVIDTGGSHNVAAAERFVDALAARLRSLSPALIGAVRTDVVAERRFAETYALQLAEPADIREIRRALERRRDWEVTRAMDLDLLDDEEEPPPEIPIAELRDKYERRHGKLPALPGDRFTSQDGRHVVLLAQASSTATDYRSDAELLERVRVEVAALDFPEQWASGMRLGYAGDVATRVEELQGLAVDLGTSGAIVLLLVIVVIAGYFGSLRALVILGVPLIYGTVCAFGLAALPPFAIRHLNSNTAFLGSIVVGNGVNGGIILLARYREERRSGTAAEPALSTALRETWRPTLAAALAAAAAYGSLVFTDFRGFNQFGWIGCFGMILCWASAMLLVPPLAFMFGGPLGRRAQARAPRRSLSGLLLAHPRLILAITTLAVIACVVGVARRRGDFIEYDLSKLRRRDSWEAGERYWGERMDATLGRYLTPTVVLAPDATQAELVAQRIRQLRDTGGAGGLVASVRGASELLPPTREAAIREARELARVLTPKQKAVLSSEERRLVEQALSQQALQPLRAEQLPDALLVGLRERSGRIDRNVLVFPPVGGGTWEAQRMQAFTEDLRRAASFDGQSLPVAGSLLLSSDIATAMKRDAPRSTALSLTAVLIIAALAFHSARLSAAAVSSVLVGVILMLGAMAWTGQRLNFSNFVALPITFGIGADYAINMLKRYQEQGGGDLRSALSATGGAVALCSLTTIIGFGSLLVAQNRALFSFGVFAVAGELACLATALLALPAALVLRHRLKLSAPVIGA